MGSSGGLVTAWSSNFFTDAACSSSSFTSTVVLRSTTSDFQFAVTNVYGPADHALADQFLDDLAQVAALVTDLWILIGDFNLTRCSSEKNTPNFNHSLATRFNQAVDALHLVELPLLDRLFTWTNKRATPTLARLDRAFTTTSFTSLFPGSTLTSGNRPTSDHSPLIASIHSKIPKPSYFRLERSWLLDTSFPSFRCPGLAVGLALWGPG